MRPSLIMVSSISKWPMRTPWRRYWQWGASDMLSWPPATTMLASPRRIACAPMTTERNPEPHRKLTLIAVVSIGRPALIDACLAGFCPWLAVRIWPKMTSETSPPSTLARLRASVMAIFPSSCAGRVESAPLNDPTGVLAALAITMASCPSIVSFLSRIVRGEFTSISPLQECVSGTKLKFRASLSPVERNGVQLKEGAWLCVHCGPFGAAAGRSGKRRNHLSSLNGSLRRLKDCLQAGKILDEGEAGAPPRALKLNGAHLPPAILFCRCEKKSLQCAKLVL